jgi:hypothetical protein
VYKEARHEATHKRIDRPTPHGGDYSEIFYFDKAGNAVDAEHAAHCIIRECKEDGTLVFETHGNCS